MEDDIEAYIKTYLAGKKERGSIVTTFPISRKTVVVSLHGLYFQVFF